MCVCVFFFSGKVIKQKKLTSLLSLSSFCVNQLLAFLETVHAALGLSRSSPGTSFAQWFGKSNVLLGILYFIPELQNTAVTATLLLVWSTGEIFRYYYYLLNIVFMGQVPKQLTLIRYNMFIPLYPLGMLCELYLMYTSQPYLEERKLHSLELPNTLNFAFNYSSFIKYLIKVYPLVWLPMYLHMFKQRSSKMKKLKAA